MGKGYSGYYKIKNTHKMLHPKKKAHYRSLWERAFCKWCDTKDKVISWDIEPFAIEYYDRANKKKRKYYPDFLIILDDGTKYLIEIKPYKETQKPTGRKGSKSYLIAEQTYITNLSKWERAREVANKNGWVFKVFTERTLSAMGIYIPKPPPKIKRYTKRKRK